MRRVCLIVAALVALGACGAEPATEPVESPATTRGPVPPVYAPGTPAGVVPTVAPPEAVAATVAVPAERSAPYDPDAECDLDTVHALAARHPAVRQFIMMATDSFDATWGTVEVVVWDAGVWRCQTDRREARYGRNGTRPLLDRRSGDGTTPAGVFPLGEVTAWDGETFQMFGNFPDPGVLADYRDVRPEDCWGATPNTPRYQRLVNHPDCPGTTGDEDLERIADVYAHAAVIGANLDPISGDEPGEIPYAAAIFLHRHNYVGRGTTSGPVEPTSGCVSLGYQDLIDVLRLIDPARSPHFAIGPVDWLLTSA